MAPRERRKRREGIAGTCRTGIGSLSGLRRWGGCYSEARGGGWRRGLREPQPLLNHTAVLPTAPLCMLQRSCNNMASDGRSSLSALHLFAATTRRSHALQSDLHTRVCSNLRSCQKMMNTLQPS